MKCFIVPLLVVCMASCANHAQFAYPSTHTVDSVDVMWGDTIKNPYRWLENLDARETKDWFVKQDDFTDSVLNTIPGLAKMKQELSDIDKLSGVRYTDEFIRRGNRYFFRSLQPGDNIIKLYYRDGANGRNVLVFDPAGYEPGKVFDVNKFDVSDDGKIVALSLAEGGKEIDFIVFKDLTTDEYLSDKLLSSEGKFADGSNDVILYRKQKTDDVHNYTNKEDAKFKMHIIGTNEDKDVEIFSRTKYSQLRMLPADLPYVTMFQSSDYMIGEKYNSSTNEQIFVAPKNELKAKTIQWKPFCILADEVKNYFVHGNDVYCITSKGNNNNKLIKVTLPKGDISTAEEIYKGGDWKIESINGTKDYLVITLSKNGISFGAKKLDFSTGQIEDLNIPLKGTLTFMPLNSQTNECIIGNSSWTIPENFYSIDIATGKFENGPFYMKPQYLGLDNLVEEEVEVPAKDGVMIPLSIYYDKTKVKMNGSNIGYITGYGAYGMSQTPDFDNAYYLVLLQHGVVMAVAHVRGGGEKGEDWHLQGMKQTKPNTWNDFNTCAEYLIKKKYTSSNRLGCFGASGGGVLAGRAITEIPGLYRVAVIRVGCLNESRAEFTPNGPNNHDEFGDRNIKKEWEWLLEMDALVHIKKNVNYPAQFIATGYNDDRVSSWEPGKFAAAMQNSSTSGYPVLLNVNFNSGHMEGSTMADISDLTAKEYTFLLWQCDDADFQSK